jgi:hypothetical protein
MVNAIKAPSAETFMPLAQEVKRFGALLKTEALELFDPAFIEGAKQRKVCGEHETELGTVIYLLHRGRTLVGMTGVFTPTNRSLMDAICLRSIGKSIAKSGQSIDLTTRRRSLIYVKDTKRILVLAQYQGYTLLAIRRLYKKLIETNQYNELHVYSFLSNEALDKLKQAAYEPSKGSQPLDKNRLHLFTLKI